MALKWNINNNNFIFGFTSEIINSTFKNIYLFDLDDTIIKTKSGKTFAISSTDWEFLDKNVVSKINKLYDNNNFIGIISNQKSLKSEFLINNWTKKINDITKILKVHVVFASTTDNKYRKPMPGSLDGIMRLSVPPDTAGLSSAQVLMKAGEIDKYFVANKIKFGEKSKKYYIGDALGRDGDHSDTDLKFAKNCNLIIKSPETFFSLPNKNNKASITYPILQYYSKKEQNDILNKLFNVISKNISDNKKTLIMCIGLPACGKSYIRNIILKKFSEFKYTNNDDINDYKKNNIKNEFFNKLILDNKNLLNNNFIFDDNTNFNHKKRNKYLEEFKYYFKIVILFDLNMDICMHLNYMRMFYFNKPLISKVVYRTLLKSNPDIFNNKFEEFNYSININKLFNAFNPTNFNNENYNLKYFF
jgi:bifunctional polynucleotide phosphatase/kinase